MLCSSLSPGASSWASLSDRSLKSNISSIDTESISNTVLLEVPVSTWHYVSDNAGAHGRRIGPMALDLEAAYQVGSHAQRIDSIDVDGVTLSALQGGAKKQSKVTNRARLDDKQGDKQSNF